MDYIEGQYMRPTTLPRAKKLSESGREGADEADRRRDASGAASFSHSCATPLYCCRVDCCLVSPIFSVQ